MCDKPRGKYSIYELRYTIYWSMCYIHANFYNEIKEEINLTK